MQEQPLGSAASRIDPRAHRSEVPEAMKRFTAAARPADEPHASSSRPFPLGRRSMPLSAWQSRKWTEHMPRRSPNKDGSGLGLYAATGPASLAAPA